MIQSGVIFNLLFLFYQILIQNWFLAGLEQIHINHLSNLWFGLILSFLILVDLIGYWYAIPSVCNYLRKSGKDRTGLFIVLWVFHCVIVISFLMFIAEAFDAKKNENLMFLFMMILMIKELMILFLFFFKKTSEQRTSKTKELIGDFCLFIFGTFAYTITWEYIAKQGTHLTAGNVVLTLLNVVVASIIFLIFFLPLRMSYILKESVNLSDKKSFYLVTGTLLFNLIEAMIQIG